MKIYSRLLISLFALSIGACNTLERNPAGVKLSPALPIPEVLGADEASFKVQTNGSLHKLGQTYDAIIVGGGLAGLAAAIYLTDQSRSVLLIEKEATLGGLATGGTVQNTNELMKQVNGVKYDRGAAYWTDTYKEEQHILSHLGFGDFHKKFPITEPADSYLWNGTLYAGIWEEETLKKLPASFSLFKFALEQANRDGQIPDQPIELTKDLILDTMSARQWIQSMPSRVEQIVTGKRPDITDSKVLEEAKDIFHHYQTDSRVDKKNNPMKDVIGLLDLYCRSALGGDSARVSAVGFANFYISEITTRYTTESGTGGVAEKMAKVLKDRQAKQVAGGALVTIATSATASDIIDLPTKAGSSVEVRYVQDGQSFQAKGKYAVYAGQIKFALTLVKRAQADGAKVVTKKLEALDLPRAKVLNDLQYSHYSVHNIFVTGHPYRATYDTWLRNEPTYSENSPTDVINGRWMNKDIKGYVGNRDFSSEPKDSSGIFTIYHPLPADYVGKGYPKEDARQKAIVATNEVFQQIGKFMKTPNNQPLVINSIITNRWPFSVHIAAPGHFDPEKVALIRKPFGNVYFANNNIGTPAFEEALFRGHCAANNILKNMEPSQFQFEKWTRCPRE